MTTQANPTATTNTAEELDIEALQESGDIVECAACGELSAYAWQYVADKPSYSRGCYDKGEIAHVGAASGSEFECGHCGAHNVEADSPLLHECYTHVSPEERETSFP